MNSDESEYEIDIDAEVDRFFSDDSRTNDKPQIVIVCGGVCSGKTTLRRRDYSEGYVVLDAAEIFLSLSRGEYYDFPSVFEEPLDRIGLLIALNALQEGRNLVTEVIPLKIDLDAILEAITKIGYSMTVIKVDCDPKLGWQRNLDRGDDNISAVFTESFHENWLLNAVSILTSEGDDSITSLKNS
ncbi:MAG: zeta toxin family protein [Planctomycetota bacterium]